VAPTALFDRQVLAFGGEIQAALQDLHVGIVGVGGTGSATLEQVVRLGVGAVSLFDVDTFDRTNVNRVYGSSLSDQGIAKVEIAERLVRSIGLGTKIRRFEGNIGDQVTARSLRDCDVIFGCTDDELGRSVLSRLAVAYRIPVFDMGVKIDVRGDTVRSIEARVTTLMPGEACLLCRGRITGEGVAGDAMRRFQPELAAELEKEGYLGGTGAAAPSVVAFTTMVASTAVTEFLHRLTGILGEERCSSEVLLFIHDGRIRTNRKESRPGCFCSDSSFIASGDRKPFLNMMWPAP
jgi:molybdopterin/thiamine biosynthesis adenylyltransferase